jgi:hypothetical protein
VHPRKGASMRTVPGLPLILTVVLAFSRISLAHAAEPVAVIIEIHLGGGQVQVRRSGEASWRPAQSLLSLRADDEITIVKDASITVVFRGARGTKVFTQADSPITVASEEANASSARIRVVWNALFQFLTGARHDLDRVPIFVRQGPPPRVAIRSPLGGRVLPGPLRFEWTGCERSGCRVRVTGPQGTVWMITDVREGGMVYPTDGPALIAGVRYRWELEAPNVPRQHASFELLSTDEADGVRNALAILDSNETPGASPTSLAVLRGAYLIQTRLYSDARRELSSALAANPAEPTLHYLQALLYERMGLADLAAQEYSAAQRLTGGDP